ncbi:MAG TPA: OmpA family protein [Thermoanaerobaculia bacterium]|nr:OmpA family protein [Thermoanaerobaculia bacterium]
MDDAVKPEPAPDDPVSELRGLLLAADEAEVVRLQQRLEDPQSRAEDVSRVLPEAVTIRSQEDRQLTDALMPTVEEAIVRSVRRNPEVLVDALFPVMGPAIRKSIANTLAEMLESLNTTLGQSFSAQGFKWRVEAWRTGKSFSEVVLLRTLLFRVEQVFLIHRKTGLLLQHVSAGGAGVQDTDMISGMLTAIRDFVHDSFGGVEADGLHAFQVGQFTVWVEQGPLAIVAGVIRGNPPRELRGVFTEAIEKIHHDQARALAEFQGDAAPFERSREDLEACLKTQQQAGVVGAPGARGKRSRRPLWAALAVVLAVLGLLAFLSVRRTRRWDSYLARLGAQPGIVVSATGRRDGKFFVTGLRDPLAADPAALLPASNLRREDVRGAWKPYQSLEPELIAARARSLLEAPGSVTLRVQDGALIATGAAPHAWIAEAGSRWRSVPGVARFDNRGLTDSDSKSFEAARAALEGKLILFARGSSELTPAETAKLADVARDLSRLPALAAATGREFRGEVVGRGDSEGTSETNLALSRRRAERVLAALRDGGLETKNLAVAGVGATQPLREERTEEDKQLNRSVSFRIVPVER